MPKRRHSSLLFAPGTNASFTKSSRCSNTDCSRQGIEAPPVQPHLARQVSPMSAVTHVPGPYTVAGRGLLNSFNKKRMGEGLTLPPHPAEFVKTQQMPSPRKRGEGAITAVAGQCRRHSRYCFLTQK